MEHLNKNQTKAAEFAGKHLLVLAGAGTGKTKTIIARAQYLISKGVDPKKIQILTFTKKAANEIVSRVEGALDASKRKKLSGSTFHAWCNHLLHKYPKVFRVTGFTILDSDDQISVMKLACGKKQLQFEKIKLKPKDLIDIFSYMRNTRISLSNAILRKVFNNSDTEEDRKIRGLIKDGIESVLKEYQANKIKNRYLDYDDMLSIVAQTLNTDPEAKKIIGGNYTHILVDEFQDTNPLQWELLKPFTETSHLFCVGDDAQSIYGFRGADFKNIHLFKENVKDSEVFKLEDNYRSTQEILDISNWLLAKSPLKYEKKLKAARGIGIKPMVVNTENEWEEASYIADTIQSNLSKKSKSYNDHLILSRGQSTHKPLQTVFLERKIPFQVFGGRKFMESAHIKDVLSALRVYSNVEDEIAWIRFLTFWTGIGEARAVKLMAEIQTKKNIEEIIEFLSGFSGEIFKKMARALQGVAENKKDLGEAVKAVKSQMTDGFLTKYSDWKEKREADFPVLEVLASKYSNVQEFISELLLDDAKDANITLQKTMLEKAITKDVVTISTIHSAKGLEADSCFVINVSPGAYPSMHSLGNEDDMEEERRVLYVALTRAKNHLYICRKKYSVYGEILAENDEDRKEAYFLNNLPEDLADHHGVEKLNTKNNKSSMDNEWNNPFYGDRNIDWS